MDKKRKIQIIKNKIDYCIRTNRHKKTLKILKKELADLS